MKFDQGRRFQIFLLVLVAFAMSLVAASPAFALFGGKVDSFQADAVQIDSNGKIINTSKLYITPDAMRMDGLPAAGMGGESMNMSILVLKKQEKMYFYNHDKKLVFEGPADESDFNSAFEALDHVESEKVLGKEKVSGYKCVKKEVVTGMTVMGNTMKDKLIVWESDKFEMPLRTMDDDGAIHEMRNIKTGKPAKKYFRPISGYKKVDNMMAVMGMDLGAMMAQDMEEDEDAQAMPNPGAAQQDMENIDVNKLMEQMGENMSPEEKAQFMETMAHVMNRVKDTKEGPGAAKKIWQFIPKRSGDKVGSELKTTNVLNVTMGSNSSLEQVFDFYKNKLTAKGWTNHSMFMQNGEGSMGMNKGDQRVSISSSENPGMKGAYTFFYTVHLNGPNL